jgi:hypothetical protein
VLRNTHGVKGGVADAHGIVGHFLDDVVGNLLRIVGAPMLKTEYGVVASAVPV